MFGGFKGIATGGLDLLGRAGNAAQAAQGQQPMYKSPYGTGFAGIRNDLSMMRYGPGVRRTSTARFVQRGGSMKSPDMAAPDFNSQFGSQAGSMMQY